MLENNELIDDDSVMNKDISRVIKELNLYYSEQKINIFQYHKFHHRDFIYTNEKLCLNVKIKAKFAAIELNKYLEE